MYRFHRNSSSFLRSILWLLSPCVELILALGLFLTHQSLSNAAWAIGFVLASHAILFWFAETQVFSTTKGTALIFYSQLRAQDRVILRGKKRVALPWTDVWEFPLRPSFATHYPDGELMQTADGVFSLSNLAFDISVGEGEKNILTVAKVYSVDCNLLMTVFEDKLKAHLRSELKLYTTAQVQNEAARIFSDVEKKMNKVLCERNGDIAVQNLRIVIEPIPVEATIPGRLVN